MKGEPMGAYDCDCINNLEYDRRERKERERLAKSQSTAGQLNDGAQSTVQSTDLIDRQMAIDALDKRFDSIPMEQTTEICLLRRDLRNLPTAYPGQQWIPVSELLPEEDGFYLVTVNYGGAAWVHESYFMQCNSRGVHWDYPNVTAWMPMPENYKGE